ncbi:MAG: hypothetical protein QXT46_00115 [Pyrobaculum sp.]
MSLYVLYGEGVNIQCDMEYSSGKDIICEIEGAPLECIEKAISRYKYIRLEKDKSLKIYIPNTIFTYGKTPGEIIKEVFTLAQYC